MRVLALIIAVFGVEFVELGVGKDSSLQQTIHSSSYFSHDESVVHKCNEVVLFEHFLGKRGDWNTNIFVFYLWLPR